MLKKIYYTVEKHTEMLIDFIEECTGYKTITVYEIKDNIPIKFFELPDRSNSDNSQKEILNWLNDNGYGDDEYKLILL